MRFDRAVYIYLSAKAKKIDDGATRFLVRQVLIVRKAAWRWLQREPVQP